VKLTYAELFAGAGGLSAGLEMAGWEPVAHAEIEPHARAVLRNHWPDCRLDGDVSQVNGTDYAGVTLLSGGSPCQDLSIAGKRSGMTEGSGTRSSLYFEQVRIWQESAAPYFLWENVLGALSSNAGRDFAAVLSALVGAPVPVPDDGWRGAGVASGPAGVAAWRVLDCQFFGPPQRRRRVFVLGARAGGVDPAQVLLECDRLCGDTAPSGEAGEGLAADTGSGPSLAFNWQSGGDCRLGESETLVSAIQANQTPAVLRGAIPLDVRNATRTTDASEQNRQGLGIGEDGDPSPTLTGLFTPAVFTYDTRGNGSGHAGCNQHVADLAATIRSLGIPRRLMPIETERLMGWADHWTAVGVNEQGEEYALSDTARYKLCGNGVASPVAGFIGWMLREAIEREA
jgi:DNA (cytosine-5)-methyltransferase 1